MTIRTRLTLLFTALVAFILAVFAIAAYSAAAWLRTDTFTRQLLDRAAVAGTVALDSNEITERLLEPFRVELLRQLPQEGIAIFDDSGKTVFSRGRSIQAPARAMIATLDTGAQVEADSGVAQYVYVRVEDEGSQYLVAASAVDVGGRRMLSQLRAVLGAGYVGAVLLVYVAGFWFSGRAMAPVAALRRRAEAISATDLHVRLDEGNGRDELARLAQSFNTMLQRLEEAFASQRQFIANASHELRTPLTALEGRLDVALMRLRSQLEYEVILHGAREDARHLRELTNNLLLMAQVEAAAPGAPPRAFRFDDVLFQSIDEAHARFPDRMIDVQFAARDEDEPRLGLTGHPTLLRAACVNLLDNALKYSPESSPVVVHLDVAPDALVLRIRDHGPGLPEEELEKIFRPFWRSPRTESQRGTGVGLALVHAIARLHGAAISLVNAPDGGCIAELRIPSAESGGGDRDA